MKIALSVNKLCANKFCKLLINTNMKNISILNVPLLKSKPTAGVTCNIGWQFQQNTNYISYICRKWFFIDYQTKSKNRLHEWMNMNKICKRKKKITDFINYSNWKCRSLPNYHGPINLVGYWWIQLRRNKYSKHDAVEIQTTCRCRT